MYVCDTNKICINLKHVPFFPMNECNLCLFFIVPTEMLILASTTEIGPYNLNCFGTFWRNTNLMASMVYFLDTDNTGTESIGLWLLSHAQFILFELGA